MLPTAVQIDALSTKRRSQETRKKSKKYKIFYDQYIILFYASTDL